MKLFKRFLLCVAVLLAVAIVFSAVGLWRLRSRPAWYKPVAMSEEHMDQVADRAEQKAGRVLEAINDAHALEKRNALALRQGRPPARAADGGGAIDVVFSQEELNAALLKWTKEYKDKYEQYLQEPMVVLEDGQIILAARLKAYDDLIVSVHVEPRIDEKGLLMLEIASLRGGSLPLPQGIAAKQQAQAEQSLRTKLPLWQAKAKVAPDGSSNEDAVHAATSELLLRMLHHQPSPAVIYLPGRLPAKLTRVGVDDHKLKLSVRPLSGEESKELLEKIREPFPAATDGQ